MANNRIHIITPMGREREAVGIIDAEGVTVGTSGIGKVNAALAAAEACLRVARPHLVVCVGCAGALDECLRLGDVVVSDRVGYWDVNCGAGSAPGVVQGEPPTFEAAVGVADMAAFALNSTLLKDGARAVVGGIVSGDAFLSSGEAGRRVKSLFGYALAIDMESAAIGHACFKCGVPFLSIRVISDTAKGDRAKEYEEFWQSPQSRFAWVGGLARELAEHARVAPAAK